MYQPLLQNPFTPFNLLCLARCIVYSIHVKMYASSGKSTGLALKSHAFAVPHGASEA